MLEPNEIAAARRLVDLALDEDLSPSRSDLTTFYTIPPGLEGTARFVSRKSGVLAGVDVVRLVYDSFQSQLQYRDFLSDGASLEPGTCIGMVEGDWRAILSGERTVLNFLQHISGIATLTRTYVNEVASLPCQIFDTRKTTPGWRLLEKYAVRCGGGHNNRFGLFDAVMAKDNHLALAGCDSLAELVCKIRVQNEAVAVIVEVDTLEQLETILPAGADVVLLDNMTLDELRAAVQLRDKMAPSVMLEASGGITLATVRDIAETGVDRVSVGALTHSAPALDIGLDLGE